MSAAGRRGRPSSRSTRRDWGWHPLSDSWARRLVADAPVGPGDLVLDVGAGTGALTVPLLQTGARVLAVELHPGRAATLRRLGHPRLTVVQADAADLRLPTRPFHVVASPPYDVASAVLKRLLDRSSRLLAADIVLQRQTARRWVEGRAPGAQRYLRQFELSLGRPVPRSAFRPPPRVDSVVLRIRRR